MPDIEEIKDTLKKTLLESYPSEYKEFLETWRSLETKAQTSLTVNGFFVAGAFAFVNSLTQNTTQTEKSLLILIIIFLCLSVGCAIAVLQIRNVDKPPIGTELEKLTTHLIRIYDKTEFMQRLPNLVNDQIRKWERSISMMEKAITEKRNLLADSQVFVITAVVLAAVLAVLKTLK
jgi:hypothetical protein